MKLSVYKDDLKSDLNLHSPTKPNFDPKYRPKIIAVDTEDTGLFWSKRDRSFGLSLAFYDAQDILQRYYWDWPVNPYTREPDYCGQKGLNLFTSYYCDPNIEVVFANAKYDIHMLWQAFGIMPHGKWHDVLVAAWCCNTLEDSYKLDDLAEKYLGVSKNSTKNLIEITNKLRPKAKKKGYQAGPGISGPKTDYWLAKCFDHNSTICEEYAKIDAGERTLNLHYYYQEAMEALEVVKTYEKEMEVMQVIYCMEERGVRFFEDSCLSQLGNLDKICTEKETQIKNFFGNPDLNINSDKQMVPYFYQGYGNGEINLKLPVIERTEKTNAPSMKQEVLRKLKGQDNTGILQAKLDYEGNNTGRKYYRNYLEYAVEDEFVTKWDLPFLHQQKSIHPNFNQIAAYGDEQHSARTGRLTGSNPNLQNVADPEKSYAIVDARTMFGPRNGYIWYCIDYSQLELRIFAERTSGKLKDAFLNGRDPHEETRINVPFLLAMNKEQGRKIAKNTNFTIINCGGAGVLDKKYGIPLEEGKIVVSQFYQEFPETRRRQREAEQFGIENGYIETLFGRKINVDLTQKGGKYIYAYRATSYDIQGSAADIIKRTMIICNSLCKESKYDAHLLLSIHDELVFEIKKEHAYKGFLKKLVLAMESVAKDVMELPLQCEVKKTYTNWSSKEKMDVVL